MKTFTTVSLLIAMTPLACAARQPRAQDAPPPPQQQAAQDDQRQQAQSDQRGQAPQTAGEGRPRNRAPRDEAAQTQGPPSNTWLARRQVRVSMGENPDAARAAVQSVTGVETIRDVASARGIPADAQVVNVRVEEDGERDAVHVWISVDLSKAPQAPRVAREVADDLVNRLRESLAREAQGGMAQQLERFRAEHDRAEAELAASRQQLTALRAKVREATGRSTASVERVRDELAQLEDRRQELQLELESKAARMEALSQNAAELSKKVEQAVQSDAVAAELQKVVDVREQKAERVKKMSETGVATEEEYKEAVAAAAEARARLIDRRNDAAERAGAGTLQDWNNELMRLSVDSAELQARLDKLNQRLQGVSGIADELDQLEALNETMESAERLRREAAQHVRELDRHLSRVRPVRSTVVESHDESGQPRQTNEPERPGDASNAQRPE